jgi:hypothetical protein
LDIHLLYPSNVDSSLVFPGKGRIAWVGEGISQNSRCGDAILAAYDKAAAWRDAGRCIISGFHSPIEKECLRILLRGVQPVIVCLARSLENLRVPAAWKAAMETQRLLILSGFSSEHHRVTADLAARRNEIAAALADDVWFAHIAPGGKSERLARQLNAWHVPFCTLLTNNR